MTVVVKPSSAFCVWEFPTVSAVNRHLFSGSK